MPSSWKLQLTTNIWNANVPKMSFTLCTSFNLKALSSHFIFLKWFSYAVKYNTYRNVNSQESKEEKESWGNEIKEKE